MKHTFFEEIARLESNPSPKSRNLRAKSLCHVADKILADPNCDQFPLQFALSVWFSLKSSEESVFVLTENYVLKNLSLLLWCTIKVRLRINYKGTPKCFFWFFDPLHVFFSGYIFLNIVTRKFQIIVLTQILLV